MNNILHSLCVNIIFFILSAAEPLKLIPGDHTVIKKDGVTHSISKYYVVPADFDPNVAANASEVSQKREIDYVNKKYTKRKDDVKNEETDTVTVRDKLDEYSFNDKAANPYSNDTEKLTEEKLEKQENTTTTLEIRSNLDPEDLSYFQVEPIDYKISSNVTSGNITSSNVTSSNTTSSYVTGSNVISSNVTSSNITSSNITSRNSDDAASELLKEFSTLVYDSVDRNLESFWGVFNNYVINLSDKNEQLIRMEKLFILLNVFTNLYKAVKMNIPIDVIIDDFTDVILKSYIESNDSDRNHQRQSKHHDVNSKKQCITKCYQLSKLDLDSRDVSISEIDGSVANNNTELGKHNSEMYLLRKDSTNNNVNVSLKFPVSSPESDLETTTDQKINIQKSELVNPNHLETDRFQKDGQDENNVLSPQQIAHESNVYDDANLDLNIHDTAETNKLPLTKGKNYGYYMPAKPQVVNNLLWSVEENEGKNIPYTIENPNVHFTPWIIDDRPLNNIPLTIDGRQFIDMPWIVNERSTVDKSPLTMHDRINHDLLLNAGNKVGSIPLTFYPPEGSEMKVSSNKVLVGGHQTPLINGVTVTNHFSKPNRYAYVLTPTKFLYGPKFTKNIVKSKSGKYSNNNLETLLKNSYGLSSAYEKNLDSNVVLNNNHSSQYYYESPLNIEKGVRLYTHDKKVFKNSEVLAPQTLQEYYESELKILNEETENNPTILRPNTFSKSPIKSNFEEEYVANEPTFEELSENSGILIPNVPSNPYGLTLEQSYSDVKIPTDQKLIDIEGSSSHVSDVNHNSQFDTDTRKEHISSSISDREADAGPVLLPPPETEYNLHTPGYNRQAANVNVKVPVSGQLYRYLRPSISTYVQGNQPSGYNYLNKVKTALAPTYELFSMKNLIKLQYALSNIKQFGNLDVYQVRALANLEKINNILLILAHHLSKAHENQRWYENILYNVRNGTPLQVYVYNLLRQKWLQQIILTLYRNNFNPRLLYNPKLFSFLGAWRFPNYVLKFLNTEHIDEHFDRKTTKQNIAKEFEENSGAIAINNYATEHRVDDYKTHAGGLVLSITEVKAGLDADVIINILKQYLLSKKYVENRENIINRGYKEEMFKKIVLFLQEKGYHGQIILDLINKIYDAVFSVEGKGCIKRQNNFVQTVYNAIVPVLRRSEPVKLV